jgi:hypothetical protein
MQERVNDVNLFKSFTIDDQGLLFERKSDGTGFNHPGHKMRVGY